MDVYPALPSATARSRLLDELDNGYFDVAIIGGGITGAGVARELTRRGLSVVVLEANDFASGTSSRSTKLIHGGLRYLAMGEFRIVRKTASERKVIHRMAKHLAEPRWMVYPTAKRSEQALVRLGVTAYEVLGGVARHERHKTWNRDALKENEPLIDQGAFRSAVVFREYVTDDARLVLANLRDAADHGAVVVNHCRVVNLHGHPTANAVEATCQLTSRYVTIRASAIVNASGPWVDPVRRLEADVDSRLILSKGVHLTLARDRLPVNNTVTMPMPDGRTLFVVRRGDATYVGTTDTLVEDDPEVWPTITNEDVDYILQAVEHTFDIDSVEPSEVQSAWAGLRPLIADGEDNPGEISRKDEIWVGDRGMITVAGGKLTGYRLMAARVAEAIHSHTSVDIGNSPPNTGILPGGSFEGEVSDLAAKISQKHNLDIETALRLASLYGSEYEGIVALGSEPITPGCSILQGEIAWAMSYEGAATLEDVFYRRTRAAWYEPNACELLHPMAMSIAGHTGWTEDRIKQEVAATREVFEEELAFQAA